MIPRLLAFALVLTVQCTIHAADTTDSEVRQWLNNWQKAVGARNVDAIMALYGQDVIAYDLVRPLQYVGKDAYRKDYEEFVGQYDGPIVVEIRDLHIIPGGDVVFLYGMQRISGSIKGQKTDMWVRLSSVLRKTNGTWLDVHDHVSVPADLETGKALLDLKP